jgi:transcriptional regulator with XRE-family HTH domain
MITNERQYRITRAEARRFEDTIAQAGDQRQSTDVHPRLQKAMVDGMRSQFDELRQEIDEYEALRGGKIRRRVLTSLLDLPDALIEARIVRGLTQKELGKKLDVAEQQIQRYESTRYAGVSLERLQEVADAVGIKLKKTIEYSVPSAKAVSKSREKVASASARSRTRKEKTTKKKAGRA